MAIPALQIYINGGAPVSGDGLNTFEQTCNTASDLRNFVGISGMQVYMRGQSTPNDGYQGNFYWNSSGNAPDDNGITTIVPNGSGTGIWSRLKDVNTTYTYATPATGFSITLGNGVGSLILKPAATLATGTVTLALAPLDGQIFRLATTQTISALTLKANTGQTINNAPTTLTAGTGVSFQYVVSQLSWFRFY